MQLSGYHVKDVIGQGGMATVYRAEHILLKQERALKIMSPELINHPGFKESFIREGQIVATLKHPNIIPIYDIEERDGYYFMAMDYLQGGNLKELLAKSSLPITRALQILQQIGSALHHAHQQQLIHRDIKPANILFNSAGDAILTDFGISKLQNTDSDLTQHGYGLLGTPRYMSPEQTSGKVLDARSDLYSLALVFYELLTGKPAIKANNTVAIIREHALKPPPKLPDTVKFLQPVLNKALAKTANERYADIPAFLHAVTTQFEDDKTLITKPVKAQTKPLNTGAKKKSKQKIAKKTKRPSLLLRFFVLLTLLGSMAGIEWWRAHYPQQLTSVKKQWQSFFSPQEKIPIEKETQTSNPKVIATVPDKEKILDSKKKEEENINKTLNRKEKTKQENQQKKINNKEKTEQEKPEKTPDRKEKKENQQKKIDNKEKIEQEKPKQIDHSKEKKPIKNKKTIFKVVRVIPYVNLYADLGNKRIGRIKKGEKVKVIESIQSPDGKQWNKIEFNGKKGYVISSKLKSPP